MAKLTPWPLYLYLPIEQKAGWAPEPVWAFWKRNKAILKSVSRLFAACSGTRRHRT